MIQYIIVILDRNSTSFCFYENKMYYENNSELIPVKLVQDIIDYSIRNNISINFLYGNHKLPDEYEKLVDSSQHIKIIPLKLKKYYNDAIFVINYDDMGLISELENNSNNNIILRLEKKDLNKLMEIFSLLLGKFKRLNLSLLGIETYSEQDFQEYSLYLKEIETMAEEEYKKGNMIELNFISDRLGLMNMNNCDAGIKHLTFAPNGKFYLCPAFYYDNSDNYVGDLENGFSIKNENLLYLKYSSVCSNCDSYHCKRCIYMNKLTTYEINVPSHQQCVISHLERNTTKTLLENLKPYEDLFQNFVDIPKIDHLDPFDLVKDIIDQRNDNPSAEILSELLSKPLENMTNKELFKRIYLIDKNILVKLKNYKYL